MVAGERTTVDSGVAGDILGVINPGVFQIGDTVSLEGGFQFPPLPRFQPEFFAKIFPKEVQKRKSFDKGMEQLTSEGAIQKLTPIGRDGEWIIAAVGLLQFEVLQYRLQDEYQCPTVLEKLPYCAAAWIEGDLATFNVPTQSLLVQDRLLKPMILFSDTYERRYVEAQNPNHRLIDLCA
jgi:peptide chain release factor 3